MKKFISFLIFFISIGSFIFADTLEDDKVDYLRFEWSNPAENGWQKSWYYQVVEDFGEVNSVLIPTSAKIEVFNRNKASKMYYLFSDYDRNNWYLAETEFIDNYNTLIIKWRKILVKARD